MSLALMVYNYLNKGKNNLLATLLDIGFGW